MEFLSAIAERFLELTLKPIGRQLGYLIFYDRNVKGLKDEFKELHDERQVVQHLVDAAQRQGEDIEEKVENWFKKVDEISEQAEKLNGEESHANTRCSYKSCPNLWLRHQISRKAKKMTQEIVEKKTKGKFDRVSFYEPPELIALPSTSSPIVNEGMDSRNAIMNQILEALVDPRIHMVGLCGLPGVGKTTLAKEVARQAKEQNLFDTVVWVIVAQDPDLLKIQTQIANNLGMKFDVDSLNARASHLGKRLKKEKNLLMVLDDLWDQLDLAEVGIPFDYDGKKKDPLVNENDSLVNNNENDSLVNNNENDSLVNKNENENDGNKNCFKILLTSRNEHLLSGKMNCKKNIKVGILLVKEAWKLFKEKAEFHDDSVPLCLATEVAQQCGGLPLAIVTVAGALRNKKLAEWEDALRRLKKPLRRNITGIREVDSSLKLSYDHLKSDGLQPIFLLSAMLSHDPLIIELLMYSVGLNLLHDVHSMKEAQDALDGLLSKLKASSLLLDSTSNERFTMHDVIREFACSIAYEEKHALVVRHEKMYDLSSRTRLEAYTRISWDKCDIFELPKEFYCPRLEFFLLDSLDSSLRIPSTFFKSMNELKVIGLTNMHFSSLPSSLGILEKLTTLCLHSCILEDITEVGNLKYLKVLSLAYSDIRQLPHELAQLACLQMLNLAHCTKLETIPPDVLSSLERLEILYMENSFNKWQAEASSEGNQNASLGELRHLQKLSSLEVHILDASVLPKDLFLESSLGRYRIFIGKNWKWGGEYETSKTLKLKLKSGIQSEHGIQKLLEGVEDLYLDELNGITNVVYDLDGRGFPNLKHLWIQNNGQIEYIVNNTKRRIGVFPNLQTLNLHNLDGLKKLCQGQIMAAFFQNLKVIKVKSCNELKSVFSISMTGLFRHLEEIVICSCKSMTEIVASTTQDSFVEQMSTANVIIFSQLCFLEICDLGELTTFYFEENATDGESDKISKSLLRNKISFPKLEKMKLASVNGLITSIWDDRLPQNSFRNLKSLFVEMCGFVKLVPLHVLKSLNSLANLVVHDCRLLETVFDFEELNNYKETQSLLVVPLKELKLWRLPKLKNLWSNDIEGMVSFRNLQKVIVENCDSLTSVFPTSIAKGLLHLEELQIQNCRIDVIVAQDEFGVAISVFPRLASFTLLNLPNLRNFYPQRHMSEWSFLHKLCIWNCNKLEIFKNEVSSSSIIQEQEAADSKYSLIFHEKFIPNLKHLSLSGKYAKMIWNGQSPFYFHRVKILGLRVNASPNNTAVFLYGLLKKFPNLEQLELWGMIGEIVFPCMEPLGDVVSPFIVLSLFSIMKVKHIWNEHSQPHILLNLERLDVKYCSDLINLGPSFISLGNLTEIKVYCCRRMINLLTSQTTRSLVQLKRLEISVCSQVEEIITKQRDDIEKEIVFKKLEYLRLDELPSLKRFCSHSYNFILPLLGQVIIRKCPKLSTFCTGDTYTPLLKGVKVIEDDMMWDTNLNKTIQLWYPQQFEYLKLDEHPDMKNIWDGKPLHHLSFSRLKSLVVDNCDFLYECVFPAHLLRFLRNLEELEVHNCPSLMKLVPSSASFENLEYLKVSECHQLIYLVTTSTAKSLVNLYELWIMDCKRMEEVVTNESEDTEGGIIFNELQVLTLTGLPSLMKLVPYSASFEKLKYLRVSGCHQLIYLITTSTAKSLVNLYELSIMDCKRMEEVVTNESEDAEDGIIFNNLHIMKLTGLPSLMKLVPSSALFEKLKYLRVSECHQLIYLVTTSTAKSLVNLYGLLIIDCEKMEEVVTNESEDAEGGAIFDELQDLTLTGLLSLKRFCPEVLRTPTILRVELEEDERYNVKDINKRIELVFLAKDGQNVEES